MGVALQEVRQLDGAIAAQQAAAAIFQEIGDRHGESMALNNLGAPSNVLAGYLGISRWGRPALCRTVLMSSSLHVGQRLHGVAHQ